MYPVSKAQQTILDKLQMNASSFQHAEEIFEKLGIVVISKGRKPPVVVLKENAGGFTRYGDGDDYIPVRREAEKLACLAEFFPK